MSHKGLLGDKMIELTAGTPAAPPQDPEVLLRSDEPSDVFSMANKVAAATEKTIEQLEPLAHALGDPQLAEDIKGTMSRSARPSSTRPFMATGRCTASSSTTARPTS